MTKSDSSGSSAGFSLVEMLVSLALISLLAIYSVRAITTVRQLDRVSVELSAQEEVDATAMFMREELSAARLHLVAQAEGPPKLQFRGEPNEVEFVTVGDMRREVGGLYLVTYRVNDKHQLIARRHILSGESQYVQDVVLFNKVSAIQFRYYTKAGEAQRTWQEQNVLPSRISVEVTFDERDTRKWPATRFKMQLST